MAEGGGGSSTENAPTLQPPRPKSPPAYPDLYGKRRELAKVQMLEREISFLEGELKFVESLQPASRYCKEVGDYVAANSDPFMPVSKKTRRFCSLWKWLCRAPCVFLSSICCFECNFHLKKPQCCDSECNICNCSPVCVNCSIPKCQCCPRPWTQCFGATSCIRKCCFLPRCFRCSDCSCKCSCSCPKVNLCCCESNCCYSCWACY